MVDDRELQAVRLFEQLIRVVHAISQDGARELRTHGLTPAQYQILVKVGSNPDCSQQQLSDWLGVTKGNVSMLAARLEEAGLLLRVLDGGAHAMVLTDAGRAQVDRLRPLHARFLAGRFAALSEGDLDQLANCLDALDLDR